MVSFPKVVEFQTISSCNAGCIICPHPQVQKELPSGLMEDAIFEKIVNEISFQDEIRIIPYLNNEPFLDPRMIDFIKKINLYCPKSEIEVSTNLSKFSVVIQNKLLDTKISELRISIFGFTAETYEKVMPGLKWNTLYNNLQQLVTNYALRSRIKKISIVMVDYLGLEGEDIKLAEKFCFDNKINFNLWGFLDRARNVKEFSNDVVNDSVYGCTQNRPEERIHITHTGDVILCCQDWRWTQIIGSIKQNSIEEIWNSNKYNQLRKFINSNDTVPQICKNCKLARTSPIIS